MKIIDFFKLNFNKEKNIDQFRKNINGEDVFSPWGGIGESYYINDIEKKNFLKSDQVIFVFGVLTLIILAALSVSMYVAFIISVNVWILMHVYYLFNFTKKLKYNRADINIESENPKKSIRKFLFIIFVVQTSILVLGIINDAQDIFLMGAYLVYLISYLLFILFFTKRNGYIFNK